MGGGPDAMHRAQQRYKARKLRARQKAEEEARIQALRIASEQNEQRMQIINPQTKPIDSADINLDEFGPPVPEDTETDRIYDTQCKAPEDDVLYYSYVHEKKPKGFWGKLKGIFVSDKPQYPKPGVYVARKPNIINNDIEISEKDVKAKTSDAAEPLSGKQLEQNNETFSLYESDSDFEKELPFESDLSEEIEQPLDIELTDEDRKSFEPLDIELTEEDREMTKPLDIELTEEDKENFKPLDIELTQEDREKLKSLDIEF